jgi:hypothetical protein
VDSTGVLAGPTAAATARARPTSATCHMGDAAQVAPLGSCTWPPWSGISRQGAGKPPAPPTPTKLPQLAVGAWHLVFDQDLLRLHSARCAAVCGCLLGLLRAKRAYIGAGRVSLGPGPTPTARTPTRPTADCGCLLCKAESSGSSARNGAGAGAGRGR